MPSCMRCNYVSPLWGSNYRMPCFIHGLTPVPMISPLSGVGGITLRRSVALSPMYPPDGIGHHPNCRGESHSPMVNYVPFLVRTRQPERLQQI